MMHDAKPYLEFLTGFWGEADFASDYLLARDVDVPALKCHLCIPIKTFKISAQNNLLYYSAS
jgi:hypothetical protein